MLRVLVERVVAGHPMHTLDHLLVDLRLVARQAVLARLHVRVGKHSPVGVVIAFHIRVHRRVADAVAEAGLVMPNREPPYRRNRHGCDHAHRGNGAIALVLRQLARVLAFAHNVLLFLLGFPFAAEERLSTSKIVGGNPLMLHIRKGWFKPVTRVVFEGCAKCRYFPIMLSNASSSRCTACSVLGPITLVEISLMAERALPMAMLVPTMRKIS